MEFSYWGKAVEASAWSNVHRGQTETQQSHLNYQVTLVKTMGTRCTNAVINGMIDGLCIGFIVGIGMAVFMKGRPCCGGLAFQEGLNCAGTGALIFGTFAALRNCL